MEFFEQGLIIFHDGIVDEQKKDFYAIRQYSHEVILKKTKISNENRLS